MENRKLVIFLLILFLTFPFFTNAYKPATTHKGLTHDTINFYEYFYPGNFTAEDKEVVEKGAMDEDNGTRALNHFYDPVYNKAIVATAVTSKEWAVNTGRQANSNLKYVATLGNIAHAYFSSPDDYSWDRAIYEYTHGDRKRGLEGLGHILHLVEDATVPDHTRGDPHPDFFWRDMLEQESPYENFTNKFNKDNIKVSDKLIRENQKPILYNSLEEYFTTLASYSNNNFFSKDTIFDKKYNNPLIETEGREKLSDGIYHNFGYRTNKDGIKSTRLVRFKEFFNREENKFNKVYFIDDKDFLILTDYWNLLSRQAVQNGAGVIKLFFDEVEKEKKILALYNKNKSWLEKEMGQIASAFSSYSGLNNNSTVVGQMAVAISDTPTEQDPEPETLTVSNEEPVLVQETPLIVEPDTSGIALIESPKETETSKTAENTPPVETETNKPDENILLSTDNNTPESKTNFTTPPDLGGAAAPPEESPEPEICQESSAVNFGTTLPCLFPPPAPNIISPSDFSASFATTTLAFIGTSSPDFIISNSLTGATTTADGAGDWTLVLNNLSEGTTTIGFIATDLSGATSTPREVSVAVYIHRPPAPAITSPAFPLQLYTKSVIFSGTTTPGFAVTNSFNASTTIATTTGAWSIPFTNMPEGTTTISFFTTDLSGVSSNPKEVSFNVYTIYPNPTGLKAEECAHRIRTIGIGSTCYLPEGSVTLSWTVGTPNYKYFEVRNWNSAQGYSLVATTSEKFITIPLSAGSHNFIVTAINIFGGTSPNFNTSNPAITSTNNIYVYAERQPVIINEIAWAGTQSSSFDEWIEIKNRTNYDVELSSFYITTEDGTPNIPLSGTIPANGYFLIERGTTGDAFSDIIADIAVPFSGDFGGSGLSNDGEVLKLVYGGGSSTTTIDQTPAAADCGGWCGGNASPDYKTMERRQADTAGTDKNNWMSNDGSYLSGHDKDGNIVNGTPRARNNVSMGTTGFYCLPYTASFVENGYYLPNIRNTDYLDCRFLSPGLSGSKFASLYRGTTASSTRIGGWYVGSYIDYPQVVNVLHENFVAGENYLSVIYVAHDSSDGQNFDNFFTGASTTPPHADYGMINWTYGPAP